MQAIGGGIVFDILHQFFARDADERVSNPGACQQKRFIFLLMTYSPVVFCVSSAILCLRFSARLSDDIRKRWIVKYLGPEGRSSRGAED